MWTKNNLKADSYLHEISTEEIKIDATRATQSLKNKKIKKNQQQTFRIILEKDFSLEGSRTWHARANNGK